MMVIVHCIKKKRKEKRIYLLNVSPTTIFDNNFIKIFDTIKMQLQNHDGGNLLHKKERKGENKKRKKKNSKGYLSREISK